MQHGIANAVTIEGSKVVGLNECMSCQSWSVSAIATEDTHVYMLNKISVEKCKLTFEYCLVLNSRQFEELKKECCERFPSLKNVIKMVQNKQKSFKLIVSDVSTNFNRNKRSTGQPGRLHCINKIALLTSKRLKTIKIKIKEKIVGSSCQLRMNKINLVREGGVCL